MKRKKAIWVRFGLHGLIIGFSLMSILSSCDEDEDSIGYIQFETETSTVNESEGVISIPISFTESLDAVSKVDFEFEGTALLDGDFRLLTPSPITVQAGERSVEIEIELIDDKLIENDDDFLKLTITSSGSAAQLSEESDRLEYTLIIVDNDEPPANDLQVDLFWNLDLNQSIDDVNLDLYLVYDVVIEGNAITNQGKVYALSNEAGGFESIKILRKDTDQQYYLVINYSKGSSDVNYTLNFNGFGYKDEMVEGDFSVEDEGFAVFWGPFYKDGSSFGRKTTVGKARLIRGSFGR
jgi:hypothetical protein